MGELVVVETTDGVRTLRMNHPRRLNGWTLEMMEALRAAMGQAASDEDVGAVLLTGTDPYYSAGVNLSSTIRVQHPRKLRDMIVRHNRELFELFLLFDKPILVAINGPAIGAVVTSATLCDAIVASDKATFSTPFAKLGVPPEGCSSVHLARLMGDAAARMLGAEGWKPTAAEALKKGLVNEVVEHADLMDRAQELAASWVRKGRTRSFRGGSALEELLEVNALESEALGDAFLAPPFLMGQFRFLHSKKKRGAAFTFLALRATRPAWSLLL